MEIGKGTRPLVYVLKVTVSEKLLTLRLHTLHATSP